ncbi:Imm10 family immunity protein [Nocardia sp. NPDC056100]|uniref:Imm10 family immunity protein n=1 Tax=Nocardia sp. NPDC056100 TaxID=3345712 RepID=UPI0035E08043
MTYRFTARLACGCDDPDADDCVLAGVAESDDDEGFILMFMCDFAEPYDQEVALGMDTHCLVTRDQGTAYGCIREVELTDEILRVTLDPESLHDLGLDDHIIEAALRAPAADLARLREVLPRILSYGRPESRARLTMS